MIYLNFRLFYLIPSGIMYDWRNDADVYILYLVMVKKYNFRITVELFLSSTDFESVRFKL